MKRKDKLSGGAEILWLHYADLVVTLNTLFDRLFNKLFSLADRHKDEAGLRWVCEQVAGILHFPRQKLVDWLK